MGYGLGAHWFLMMKHTELGGVFETSLLKLPKSVPPMRPYSSLPFLCERERERERVPPKLRAQHGVMGERHGGSCTQGSCLIKG